MDIRYLREIPLLSAVDDKTLECLLPLVSDRKYEKNQVIFLEGDPVEAIYFLKSGLVKVFILTPDGKEQTINILQAGDFFPHMGYLEGGDYPATAQTLCDSRLAIIRRADLLSLLQRNCGLTLKILLATAERMTTLQKRYKDLLQRDLIARVGRALLWLAESHGVPSPEGIRLNIHLTHQELANLVGAARESVSRIMSDFKKDELIGINKEGALILKDKGRLIALALIERAP